MKKIKIFALITVIALLSLALLASCSGSQGTPNDGSANGNTNGSDNGSDDNSTDNSIFYTNKLLA